MSGAAEKPKRELKPIHWAEHEGVERPPYLVKGLLNEGGMSVLYGEPSVMKSFVALDMALHVALNRHWHGQRVKGGPVLYIACEGGWSIWDRVTAFAQHHEVSREGVPFHVLPETVNLGDEKKDLRPLVEAAVAIGGIKLIVIDTLSRALFGGNENSSDDMGMFIACCDTLRRKTGAHVLIIHHTGKKTELGARGHSSLKAATDTEITVTKSDGICLVDTTKQRDMAENFDIGFRWKSVEIGEDEDGDPMTSLVLEPTEERPVPEDTLKGAAKTAYKIIWDAIKREGIRGGPEPDPPVAPELRAIYEERWKVLCLEAPLSSCSDSANDKAFRRAKKKLEELGKIGSSDGWVWPWPKDQEAGEQERIPF